VHSAVYTLFRFHEGAVYNSRHGVMRDFTQKASLRKPGNSLKVEDLCITVWRSLESEPVWTLTPSAAR